MNSEDPTRSPVPPRSKAFLRFVHGIRDHQIELVDAIGRPIDPRLGRTFHSLREQFQAITTAAELVQEADRMKHCVVTRASEVMAGSCALYRVNVAGQRATLELAVGRNGEPLAIEEFRLACNLRPSEAAWRAAREWLEEGRKRWRDGRGRQDLGGGATEDRPGGARG